MDPMDATMPSKWTWRDQVRLGHSVLSGPRRHASGDSSNHAIIGAMEAKYCLELAKSGRTFGGSLSIQHSLDLTADDYLPVDADIEPILTAISSTGVTKERYYPYLRERNPPRALESVPSYRIQNIRRLGFSTAPEKEKLMQEILQGPLVCSFPLCADIDTLAPGEVYHASVLQHRFNPNFPDSDPLFRSGQVTGYVLSPDQELLLEYQDTKGPSYLDNGYGWLALVAVSQLWAFDVGPYDRDPII